MTPAIWRRFEILEQQKRAVLSTAAGLSAAQLCFRPSPAEWCALDVLDHLVKVEEAALGAVQEQLPGGARISWKDRAGGVFITMLMLWPIRIKVPAGASMVIPDIVIADIEIPSAPLPDTTALLSDIAATWSGVRERVAVLLGTLQPEQLRVGLFRHPVSGWMSIARGLTFLSAHLRHHEYQLNRLKSKLRKP